MNELDIACCQAALDVATLGPLADPNPQVGCILVDGAGAVAAAGFHAGAGSAHAEVAALQDAANHGRDITGGTAYVTLEPCTHTGRTGPCTSALLAAGVARVVVLRRDLGSCSGGGVELLRAAGVEVTLVPELRPVSPTLQALTGRARELVRYWACAVERGRPFVTWKFASTLDGRSAAADGTSQWITGAAARADVHRRRAHAGAVVVGTGTVLADDPELSVRDNAGLPVGVQPLRVVVGEREIPANARVLRPVGDGAQTLVLRTRDVRGVLAQLHEREIRHVWLEGGPTLAAAFVGAGVVDQIIAYVAPALLGAGLGALGDFGVGTIAQAARFELSQVEQVGQDVRIILRARPEPAGGLGGVSQVAASAPMAIDQEA